jgi:hypothetical protein
MAHLSEVRSLIHQGDKRGALKALQQVIKEQPSADAWYMAARLTDDRAKARKYLQRALMLDPTHRKASDLLHEYGGKRKSTAEFVASELTDTMIRTGGKTAGVRRLSSHQRVIVLGSLGFVAFLFIAAIVFIVVANLVMDGGKPERYTAAPAHAELQGQALLDHFSTSGLTILESGTAGVTGDELDSEAIFEVTIVSRFDMTVLDIEKPNPVRLYIYENQFDALMDRQRVLDDFETVNVVRHHNINLIYPTAMDPDVASTMIDILRWTPLQEVQS